MSFKTVMGTIWDDIQKLFQNPAFQTGVKVAESVVDIALPPLGPAFTLTANAVLQTEANFAAVGKSSGTGTQKLASVITSSGNLIAQAMKDAGAKDTTQKSVENYVSAVCTILNLTPSLSAAQAPPAAPAPQTATA